MRVYEINTRVHCSNFDQITSTELAELAQLGFDAVWLMGVWQISDGARRMSKVTSQDFEGSPYAVPTYDLNRELGGTSRFTRLVKRAHASGLSVIVDFVSNHMALDSPWITQQPELFIRSDPSARVQSPSEYFLHRSSEVVAFGRDPYFPPWTDTAQLNYANVALRERMVEVLKRISSFADGVRCDMAMLVLRDCFRRLWYPTASDESFDRLMPGEFWSEAVEEVKKINPNFKFIAEAYWDKEHELLSLGFDLCYEKKLYDGLVNRDLALILERLQRDSNLLLHSLYFIENHDEPRAAAVFGEPENLSALALILSIPGSTLIHEGQMEGRHERLPVQRLIPLTEEPPNVALRETYVELLKITAADVFRNGSFQLFDPAVYGVIGCIRRDPNRVVGYLGQISDAWHRFNGPAMNVSGLARAVGAQGQLRLTNLLNHTSMTLRENNGFYLEMSSLGVDESTKFCLLEATPG